ncbi:MAG: hypothetical protein CMH30_07085 [Micavibrio sp.]|nr:hypothetical protein [Micavibrio sp.]
MEKSFALKAFNEQTIERYILSVNGSYAPEAVRRKCAKFLKDKNGAAIDVEAILGYFSRSVPESCRLKVEIRGDTHGAFLEVLWFDKETSKTVLRDVRSFSIEDGTSAHGNIVVDEAYRGQKLGAEYAFDMFRFMDAIQIRDNQIIPSSVNGGHFWSLMAVKYREFEGEEDDWRNDNKISDQLAARIDMLEPYLPVDLKDDLERLLYRFSRSKNPQIIWQFSDFKYDLRSRGLTNKVLNSFADGYQMNAEAVAYLKKQKALPLGRLMMVSTTWEGFFDTKDKTAIKRLEKFVGRSFKTGETFPVKKSTPTNGKITDRRKPENP